MSQELNRPMSSPAAIYTIGHSTHSLDDFLSLLARQEIGALVDIRRFPGSRKWPHYNRENLAAALAEQGIAYHWLESLGGRRKSSKDLASPNLGLRNDSFRNYADYMLTEEFREGVDELLKIARRRKTAMMCAESLFWRCHRRLVSDYLLAHGHGVEHIFPDGEVRPHALTRAANVESGRVTYPAPRGLFDDETR
jgi:uncharacterized protein (DUF488 family)